MSVVRKTRVVPNPRGSVIIDRRLPGKQRVSAAASATSGSVRKVARKKLGRKKSTGEVVRHAALAIAIAGGASRE
jgi:hypothetical protein